MNPNLQQRLTELTKAFGDHVEQLPAHVSPAELVETAQMLRDTYRKTMEAGEVPPEADFAFSPDVPLEDRREFIRMSGEAPVARVPLLPVEIAAMSLEERQISALAEIFGSACTDDPPKSTVDILVRWGEMLQAKQTLPPEAADVCDIEKSIEKRIERLASLGYPWSGEGMVKLPAFLAVMSLEERQKGALADLINLADGTAWDTMNLLAEWWEMLQAGQPLSYEAAHVCDVTASIEERVGRLEAMGYKLSREGEDQ